MKRMLFTVVLGALAGAMSSPPAAQADSPEVCAPTRTIDPLRLLRQASLDLRGRIPSYDEYEAVRDAADPQAEVDARIEQMLQSEEYFGVVREYHRALLWSTVAPSVLQNVVPNRRRLGRINVGGTQIWRINARSFTYRGGTGIDCIDQQQTNFDGNGRPIPITTTPCGAGTCDQEGWVMVHPYWDPNPAAQIRVCAFDAQDFQTAYTGQNCRLDDSVEGCGCGDDLEFCAPVGGGTVEDEELRVALAEEPLRIFESVVRNGDSYLDAFATESSFVNGILAHYYENVAHITNQNSQNGVVYDLAYGAMPALDYHDADNWTQIARDTDHAGVLTSFAYLIRFASNRSRANRFYTAFLCDPFVPPEGGIPAQEPDPPPNLRVRNGCDGCHQVLEPAAAHFARWRTGGQHGFLDESYLSFTTPNQQCASCGPGGSPCSQVCNAYYVTAENSHPDEVALYAGMPLASAWLEGEDAANVEAGPAALVDTADERHAVARCTTQNLATHLLGRDLEPEELDWLDDRTGDLEQSGHDFTALYRALVADERYRSIE